MAYKPVKRVVTVEFVKGPRRGEYDIRITPEQVVVRFGDTIVWDVQGLSATLATQVAFGVFVPLEVSPRLRQVGQRILPSRLWPLPKPSIQAKAVGGRFLAVHRSRAASDLDLESILMMPQVAALLRER